jgi:hypothetical protein
MSLHRLSRNSAQPAVGRDVEAWCQPCGMALTHTIMAMVGLEIAKVKCNTCGAEHKYKSLREAEVIAKTPKAPKEPKEPKERKPAKKAVEKAAKVTDSPDANRSVRLLYQRAMADRDRAQAVGYIATMTPRPGQLVDHKLFGFGIVDAVFEGKSRFLFEAGYKVLVTGRP